MMCQMCTWQHWPLHLDQICLDMLLAPFSLLLDFGGQAETHLKSLRSLVPPDSLSSHMYPLQIVYLYAPNQYGVHDSL